MLGFDGEVLSRPLKKQILTEKLQNREKSTVKHFIGKPMLLNFVDLSTIFCPKLLNQDMGYLSFIHIKYSMVKLCRLSNLII